MIPPPPPPPTHTLPNVKSTSLTLISLISYPQAYANQARETWVKEWPGQVVLCVSQIYWTIEVHEAIASGAGGLQKYWDTLQLQLSKVVELVRGKLTKQQRITLGALVTIDVHARDVVLEMVGKGEFWTDDEKLQKIGNFIWFD